MSSVDLSTRPSTSRRRTHSQTMNLDSKESDEKVSGEDTTDDDCTPPRKRIKKEQRPHHTEKDGINVDQTTDDSTMDHAMSDSHHRTMELHHHLQSSVQHCDPNSLSVIFSFLRSQEFSVVLQVSLLWHSIGEMNTAWPSFNLESFIHQLEEENYSGSGQRRVVLTSNRIASSLNHPITKRVNDIILSHWSRVRPLPVELSEFPYLTALNIKLRGEVNTAAFTHVMKDRLRVLIVSSPWTHIRIFSTLHELSTLRVLVTNFPIPSSQLEQLTQLEYLHVDHCNFPQPGSMPSVRLLSVYHSLRYLSLSWDHSIEGFWSTPNSDQIFGDRDAVLPPDAVWVESYLSALDNLTNEWKRTIEGGEIMTECIPAVRLSHFSLLGIDPPLDRFISILSIPELQHFACETNQFAEFDDFNELKPFEPLSRLLHLSLRFDIDSLWDFENYPPSVGLRGLKFCTSLQSLRLSVTEPKEWDRVRRPLCDLYIELQYMTELEDLSIAYPLFINEFDIEGLASCKRLRHLDLSNRPIIESSRLDFI